MLSGGAGEAQRTWGAGVWGGGVGGGPSSL